MSCKKALIVLFVCVLVSPGVTLASKNLKVDKRAKLFKTSDKEVIYDAILEFCDSKKWSVESDSEDRRGDILMVIYKETTWTSPSRANIRIACKPDEDGYTEVRVLAQVKGDAFGAQKHSVMKKVFKWLEGSVGPSKPVYKDK